MDDLTAASKSLQRARNRLAIAIKQAELAAIAAHKGGKPETEIARALGVNRMTVRRWLGKL